ncbi:hypothetical protein PBY51_022213 [Eleginops maclovinus]|uniref:Phospholipase A1 member A n=1 Tax=Eleginops maclovinus TaxID=56733 RepID=A0AAN7XHG8_ELEMC|nr:hypothetical protein PBY51_022213 [Eleginops maclovinus]
MSWTHTSVLLCVLTVCVMSLVLGSEEAQSGNECADLNNYTFREYRQQRGKVQVQYLLLTRRNMNCAERFDHESFSETHQPPSTFNISRPTKVIIHGFRTTGSKPTWVVENYKEAALEISVLINQLQKHGCKLESFHFIGISLGAHVAGFVGTLFEGKIGRITALDAAGPLFKGADASDRLDPSDALFVEAIHTDSDYFGISIPVGHVDFYLNGGKDQPGCARSRFSSMFGYVLCDHMRAIYVYMSVLNSSCPLVGLPCFSYEDFMKGRCLTCDAFNGKCPTIGLSENGGITISPLPQEQKLFLLTASSSPFCTHQILLQLEVSPLHKSAEVGVTLVNENQGTEQRLRLQKDTTVYSMVLFHPVALCEINSIKLENTGNRFYRQGDINVKSVCLSEIPSQRREEPLCVNNINIRHGAPWSHDFVQVCGFL